MLPPGLLQLVADIAGIILYRVGGIPGSRKSGLASGMSPEVLTMVVRCFSDLIELLQTPRVRQRMW